MPDLVRIHLVDPRAVVRTGLGLGFRPVFVPGESRGPYRCLLILKPRGGTARTWKEVVCG